MELGERHDIATCYKCRIRCGKCGKLVAVPDSVNGKCYRCHWASVKERKG